MNEHNTIENLFVLILYLNCVSVVWWLGAGILCWKPYTLTWQSMIELHYECAWRHPTVKTCFTAIWKDERKFSDRLKYIRTTCRAELHSRSSRQSVYEMCLMELGSERYLSQCIQSSCDSNWFRDQTRTIGELWNFISFNREFTNSSGGQPDNNHLNEVVFEHIKHMNTKYTVGIWRL